MKNNKNFDLYTTLIIVYLALLTLCIALYALIQIYVDDKGTATNLMIWSATLFPSIALLYTFNSWRDQKGSEIIANEANEIVKNLSVLHENIRYIRIHSQNKNDALFMLKDIERLSNKNKRELLFLKASIIDEDLENFLDIFLKHERNLLIKIEYYLRVHTINDFLDEMIQDERLEELRLYTYYLDNLIIVVRPYSLYQNPVFLKKHKPKSA
jgi:hypothetical protein